MSEFGETAITEKEDLEYLYRKMVNMWDERTAMPGMPKALSSDLFLVDYRLNIPDKDAPKNSFVYINDHALLRLNLWASNAKNRTAVVSAEMYTQGLDGTVRGKGKDALVERQQIVKALSQLTGVTIYDFVVANNASRHLFEENGGYSLLNVEAISEIYRTIDTFDADRVLTLLKKAVYKDKTPFIGYCRPDNAVETIEKYQSLAMPIAKYSNLGSLIPEE